MRTHRTMALAATLSVAATAAAADLTSGAPAAHAHADSASSSPWQGVLAALRSCESSGDYTADTGNGYYGAYQFEIGTWQSLGYSGYPHEASPAVQDQAVARLYAARGWTPWPGCSAALDLQPISIDANALAPVEHVAVDRVPVDKVKASSMVVVEEIPEEEPPPAPPAETRPAHSRFSQLVAEFG